MHVCYITCDVIIVCVCVYLPVLNELWRGYIYIECNEGLIKGAYPVRLVL